MTEPQNASGLMDQIHTLRLAKSQYEDTLVAVHAALDDTLGRDHRTRDDSAAASIRRLAADAEKRGAEKATAETIMGGQRYVVVWALRRAAEDWRANAIPGDEDDFDAVVARHLDARADRIHAGGDR